MPTAAATELPGSVGTRFHQIHWFDDIDSTNRYLIDAARTGAPNGLVAVADMQSAGRGRLGRSWQAPVGASLLVSVLLRPQLPIDQWPLLMGPAGLSAVAAVTTLCDLGARLKWPNDVVVGDRKIAGLLAEATNDAAVIGMGLNIDWADVPDDIAHTATAVSLSGGRVQSRRVILDAWLRGFDARLRLLESGPAGLRAVRFEQLARSATLGRRVRVEASIETIEGVAIDINPGGQIVVQLDDGTIRSYASGDVVHLRALDGGFGPPSSASVSPASHS